MKKILASLTLGVLFLGSAWCAQPVNQVACSYCATQTAQPTLTPTSTPTATPTWTPAATLVVTVVQTPSLVSDRYIVSWPITVVGTGAQTLVAPPNFYPSSEEGDFMELTAGALTITGGYTIRGFDPAMNPTNMQAPSPDFGGNGVTFTGGVGQCFVDRNSLTFGGSYINPVPWTYWYFNVGTFGHTGAQTLVGHIRMIGQ